nr:hypothetical chloroplast RF19 [Evolvulus alsinoides]UKO32318.1 hypothetical chloroplast RF19 [Evolvulus alsinoides]
MNQFFVIVKYCAVTGLYYGFLTTFTFYRKPSFLFLLRARVMEEEETAKVQIAAITGAFITGQLVIFISIYYVPLYLALSRPITISALTLLLLSTSFFCKNHKDGSTNRNSLRNLDIYRVFLIHLILQLLNTSILDSATLVRLVSISMFRSNNKILFVTSSFVGWLIGQILVMKSLEWAVVCIRKNLHILSKSQHLFRKEIAFLNRNFTNEILNFFCIFGGLVFFIRLHYFGIRPFPIFPQPLTELTIEERLEMERKKREEKNAEREGEERDVEKDPSSSPLERGDSDKEVDLKKTDSEKKEKKDPKKVDERPLLDLLFDYKRWNRPFRYIQNNRLDQAVRNEMSQYFFDTHQSDGKERISFTLPRSLSTFWKMIKRKISLLSLEKTLSNELDDGWVSINKQKMNNLKNDFVNRINNLDKAVGILETRTRLCIETKQENDETKQENDEENDETKQEYLPKKYDPFLNGPYRGRVKKELSPSMILIKKSEGTVMLNPLYAIFFSNPNYLNWGQKTDAFEKKPFEISEFSTLSSSLNLIDSEPSLNLIDSEPSLNLIDSEPSLNLIDSEPSLNLIDSEQRTESQKDSIGIKEIRKKVPRWSYRLVTELQQLVDYQQDPPEDHEIRSRKGVYVPLFDVVKDFEIIKKKKETKTTDKETKTADKETNTTDKETKTTDKETKTADKETKTTDKETKTADKETKTTDKETKTADKETKTTDKPYKGKITEEEFNRLFSVRYSNQSDFRQGLIKASMRAQRRKIVIEELFQANVQSPLFFDRKKTFFSFAIAQLKRIFRNWAAGKGFRILESTDEQTKILESTDEQTKILESTGEQTKILESTDEQTKREEKKKKKEKEEKERLEIGELWDTIPNAQVIRCLILITQSFLRKNILLPSLIIGKNIGRMLLLQIPELFEDLEEWNREVHIICTYSGLPLSETKFPENWATEGIQIKIVFPFHLQPWHRPKPLTSRDNFCFLTVWGRETAQPFGPPRKIPSFFKPVLKELEKKIRKYKTAQSVLKIKLFQKVSKESGMKKEKDSRISNQIINESFSQSEKIEIPDWTNSSLIETKMQAITDRTSTIKNQIERINQEKKKVTLELDMNPYKKNDRLELSKKIWQIVKITNNRLICKFHYFLKFFIQIIYNDIFLYTINSRRLKTQLFVESTKNFIDKYISKNETNQKRIHKKTKNTIHFISNRINKNSCEKNSDISCDLSHLSQAYVFYKISQTGVFNLCQLRSVLQHHGTSLFLKTKIKDSLRTQGISQSEVIHNKLHRSRTSQWKNWLKGNSQYDFSQVIWSSLMSQRKTWRNRVNRRSKKKYFNKWNSCGKDRLSHYKKQKGPNSLLNPKNHFQKCYRYDLLSYKSINYENSVIYRSTPQGIKRQAISYNYNMSQSLFAIPRRILFNNLIGRMERLDIPYKEKNLDRKYLNWENIHFSLTKKVDIESWVAVNPNSNQKTTNGTNNYQLIDQIDQNDQIDQKNDQIKKDLFYLPINQNPESNSPNSPNSFFDWMGLNEQILNRPFSMMEFWFFPEFVHLFHVYKMKPWSIPSKLLLLNLNQSETNEEDQSQTKGPDESQTKGPDESQTKGPDESQTKGPDESQTKGPDESQTKGPDESQTKGPDQNIAETQKDLGKDSTKSDMEKDTKQEETEEELPLWIREVNKCFLFQFRFYDILDQNRFKNLQTYCLLLRLIHPRKMTLSCIRRRRLNLSIMPPKIQKNFHVSELAKKMRFFIDSLPLSVKNNGEFLMYQTVGISLVHKSKHQTNQEYRKETIREQNHFDALVLENILSSRRRRELRILICFNSNNWNGVDTNSVFCNENRGKNCSQFWDERNLGDKEKNELIQLKFFLWPNYRLEDLACMNRYWFDTNNGSRFGILRIHMYLPLRIR